MPLSPSTLSELQAELKYIENLRKDVNDKLDARAEVIRAVLEPFDVGQTKLPFLGQQSTATSPMTHDDATYVSSNGHGTTNKFANTGLRAAILETLKTHGPLRAPAIAKLLQDAGFHNDSKTPLATRVYNDLWRMKEVEMVEGVGGQFALK